MKLPYRIIVLLSFLQELGERVTQENFNSLMFIYCHQYTNNNSYHFIPAQGSQFSIQLQEDQKLLVSKGMLHNFSSQQSLERFAIKLNMFDKFGLQKLKNDIDNNRLEDIATAWNAYFVPKARRERSVLYTIGYEGVSLEQYLNKLLIYGVKCLCDVRRNPYSQKYGFSKTGLQEFLELIGIQYIHMPELGIASSLRQELDSKMDYYKLLTKYENELLPQCSDKIEHLESLLKMHEIVAITCFEANVSHCHRGKIAKLMRGRGNDYEVVDI